MRRCRLGAGRARFARRLVLRLRRVVNDTKRYATAATTTKTAKTKPQHAPHACRQAAARALLQSSCSAHSALPRRHTVAWLHPHWYLRAAEQARERQRKRIPDPGHITRAAGARTVLSDEEGHVELLHQREAQRAHRLRQRLRGRHAVAAAHQAAQPVLLRGVLLQPAVGRDDDSHAPRLKQPRQRLQELARLRQPCGGEAIRMAKKRIRKEKAQAWAEA